jgi:hypothetical protein
MTTKFINVFLRGSVVWLIIIVAESVHGTLRELFLTPLIGDVRARQFSFVTALVMILTIALIFVSWIRASRKRELLVVGISWAILTFVFEAFVVRPFFGFSWQRFFVDYDISQGGLMVVGLLVLAFTPLIAAWTRANTIRARSPDKHWTTNHSR